MRNLKRALSLTLASVMLLGMMVVGTSAASFPDVTENDNVEAIEVLAAVKVLQGRDDGSFDPTATVTRNEMATIICRMMGWRDGDFAGLNPFPDVPAWASNYVAACVANGIINGRDDGRFHGDDTVTATEAASMMLRALGYTRMPVGAAWAQAVAQQASKINLFDGLDVGAYTAMNRGDVAQLALNTLESPMVEVEDNTLDINAGNGVSISGGQLNYVVVTSNKPYAKAISSAESNGNALNGVQGPIVELGEQVFNGDLKRSEPTDAFQNPAVRWSYKTREVGTYAKGADLTYLKDVKLKDIYSDLGLSRAANTVTFAVDGDTTATDNKGAAVDETTFISSNDNKVGGKGAVTKVYYKETTNSNNVTTVSVTITVTNYYLAKATEDYDSSNKEIDVSFKGAVSLNDNTLKLADFPVIADMKKDDYLVVTVAKSGSNYDVKSAAPATVVENVVVTAARKDDYVTAGEKYEYSDISEKSGSGAVGQDLMANASGYTLNDKDNTYNLYLDPNGYVLGVEGYNGGVNVSRFLFVKEIDNGGTFTRQAKVVFSDGSDATITVSKINKSGTEEDVTDDNFKKATEANKFYRFTTDSKGNYKLTAIGQVNGVTQGSATDKNLENDATPIESNGTQYADSTTVFIAKDKAYTGVANAPKITSYATGDTLPGGGTAADDNLKNDIYFLYEDAGDHTNRVVLLYANQAGIVEVNVDELTYILSKDAEVNEDNGTDYYIYKAWVNGENVSVEATTPNAAPGLYKITSYSDGRAVLGSPITTTGAEFRVGAGVTGYRYSEPTLTITGGAAAGSYVLTEDARVFTIDGTTAKEVNPDNLTNKTATDGFKNVILVQKSSTDTKIVAVYVVKASGTKAVYESTSTPSVSNTPATSSVAGVAVTLTGKTEDNKMQTVLDALKANTLKNSWDFTLETDGSIKAVAKTAGAEGTTGPAALTDFTQSKAGAEAEAEVKAKGSITLDTTTSSITIGGETFTKDAANTNTATDTTAKITATFDSATNVVSITSTQTGTAGNGDVTVGGKTVTLSGGKDAVAAKAAEYTLAKNAVTLGGDTITFDSVTYTVTGADTNAKLQSWADQYNADATHKWVVTVNTTDSKLVYTAKVAGALTTTGATAPAGATQITAGADW